MFAQILTLVLMPLNGAAGGETLIPTEFAADRVYVVAETESGQTLRLYTDTGGGLFLTEAAVKRLNLKTVPITDPKLLKESGATTTWALLPRFRKGRGIPAPFTNEGRIAILPDETLHRLWMESDGMLGEMWFGGRIWTWDYPDRRLVLEGAAWKPPASAKRVPLGFAEKNGKRQTNFPRITITVDGKPLDMLLDTGATTSLTPETLKLLADGMPAQRATSMIVDTVFKSWRSAHPDWRVMEDAQAGTHSAMIEVPEVDIAGSKIGPVWFTWRPDTNFHDYMSGMMDARVEGAIGGNALRHFIVTINYPGAAAYFQCTKDCNIKLQPAP